MRKQMRHVSFFVAVFLLFTLTATSVAAPPVDSGPRKGQVTIIRDDYGVPHVYGSTLESLWFGVGYAQGQDRLWQADLLRRTVNGTSAEFFGPSALGGDIFARTMWGPAEWRAGLLASASPETRLTF